jgi:hypothetical protein
MLASAHEANAMAGRTLADLSIDNRQDGLFRVNRQTFTDADRCHPGCRNREVLWHGLSRSMRKSWPEVADAWQMRAFWRPWHALMQSSRGAVRPPIAV